jgi:hypothetical protein
MRMFGRGGEGRKGDKPKRARLERRWFWALAAVAGIALLLFVLWIGPWLLTRDFYQELSADQALKARNDVRTALVQAVAGLAVASGAVVTYRTFRHTRLEQDRAYITDTYTRAVEQLGHDHAPVRLGALYSLVSLAQDNPPRRQTVVDVLCAYLRMPYTPLLVDESGSELVEESVSESVTGREQELQVRLTAQRLLGDHLRPPRGISGRDAQSIEPSPREPFWPGISFDLSNAILVGFEVQRISAVDARFVGLCFAASPFLAKLPFSVRPSSWPLTFLTEATSVGQFSATRPVSIMLSFLGTPTSSMWNSLATPGSSRRLSLAMRCSTGRPSQHQSLGMPGSSMPASCTLTMFRLADATALPDVSHGRPGGASAPTQTTQGRARWFARSSGGCLLIPNPRLPLCDRCVWRRARIGKDCQPSVDSARRWNQAASDPAGRNHGDGPDAGTHGTRATRRVSPPGQPIGTSADRGRRTPYPLLTPNPFIPGCLHPLGRSRRRCLRGAGGCLQFGPHLGRQHDREQAVGALLLRQKLGEQRDQGVIGLLGLHPLRHDCRVSGVIADPHVEELRVCPVHDQGGDCPRFG